MGFVGEPTGNGVTDSGAGGREPTGAEVEVSSKPIIGGAGSERERRGLKGERESHWWGPLGYL